MTPPSPPEGRAETRARLEQLAADYVTETRPRRALPGADDYDWLLTALLRADAEQPRTPQPQAHAALVAFCESTAAGCRAEAQRCEVEAEMNRRDGSPLIASMYTRIAESARERAAKFDQLAALAAGASQATGEPQKHKWKASDHHTSGFVCANCGEKVTWPSSPRSPKCPGPAPAAEPEPSEGP
jgi:hypothetical protein